MQSRRLRRALNVEFTAEGHLALKDAEMHGCAVFDAGGAQNFELRVTALRDDRYIEPFAGTFCIGIIGASDVDAIELPQFDPDLPDIDDLYHVTYARRLVSQAVWWYSMSTGSFKISGCNTLEPSLLFETCAMNRLFPGSLTQGRTLSMQYSGGRLGYKLDDAHAEFTDVTSKVSDGDLAAAPPLLGKGKLKGKEKGKGKGKAEHPGGFAPCVWLFGGGESSIKVEVRPAHFGVAGAIVAKRMRTLWEDRVFADCTIECGGESFAAHRAVLCTASPVFSAAFNSSMREAKENRYTVRDCQLPNAVKAMLQFIYTGGLPELGWQDLVALLPLAVQYELKDLRPIVATSLVEKVTAESVREIVKVLGQFSDQDGTADAYSILVAQLKENDELLKKSLVR